MRYIYIIHLVKLLLNLLKENYPAEYHQIEQELLLCKMQVISLSQMIAMITKNTTISVTQNSAELIDYLHNNRSILHFSQVESLKDIVIPNPHWLAKLFGYVLTIYPCNALEPEFQRVWKQLRSFGILHETLLCHILAKYYTDFPILTISNCGIYYLSFTC